MLYIWNTTSDLERVKGIEPSQPAWKAGALPLSYTRILKNHHDQTSTVRDIWWIYGADDEIRTRDPRLGKAMLYHWATSAGTLIVYNFIIDL